MDLDLNYQTGQFEETRLSMAGSEIDPIALYRLLIIATICLIVLYALSGHFIDTYKVSLDDDWFLYWSSVTIDSDSARVNCGAAFWHARLVPCEGESDYIFWLAIVFLLLASAYRVRLCLHAAEEEFHKESFVHLWIGNPRDHCCDDRYFSAIVEGEWSV